MDLAKKLTKVFSLIFLAMYIASCDSGCVEADEFDKAVIEVDSNPIKDGIDGVGDSQVAKWHDTGLKSNGDAIVLQVTGAWTPWYGDDDLGTDAKLKTLDACGFCAMNATSPNCLCYQGQTSTSESGYTGGDCATNPTAQNDPSKCTCTTKYGTATDYGVYHFTLNKYDKYHNELNPDNQSPCKYQAGMGLYMGLFGSNGNVMPIRVYHLFSQTSVCDVVRNAQGECLDSAGNDVTKYIFSSANNATFVKDDGEGNNGPDANTSDDTYHSRNEVGKLIILDSRYSDNYGKYKVTFLSGLGSNEDTGLLEFIVRLVENTIMGTPDDSGVRQGGIIQTMFNQIVLDSGFVSLVQMGLSFYIIFYGVAVLIGLADVSKKELMSRSLKIALVIFFTSKTSWYWYDKLVVTFFKDGMDSVITMFMNFSDKNLDATSGIITAQMDRVSANSNATRFSYADLIIRNLISEAAATKIFGLFFGVPFFGLIYIFAIYALIVFFIWSMITVAQAYVITIVKLAFVLALGPIFIAFTLSGHTSSMFKNWLSFVGARSLEIIIMFLVLYNFLVLIDQNFTSLLSYKACVTNWNLGRFSFPIIKSYTDRSLIEWCSSFVILGALILIMQLVMDKVPDLCKSLITIGGVANKDAGGMAGAKSMMGGLMGVAQTVGGAAASVAATAAAKGYQGVSSGMSGAGTALGNGISGAIRSLPGGNMAMDSAMKAYNSMPSNPRAMYRNSIIDSAIKDATKNADAKGLTGAKKDAAIRNEVTDKLLSHQGKLTSIGSTPNQSVAIGLNLNSIGKRLDEKLINQPLAAFIKSEAAKLKNSDDPKIGRELRDEMQTKINKWATDNLAGGADSVKGIMNDRNAVVSSVTSGDFSFSNVKQLIRNETEYSAAEAAKAFANNPEKQKEYLQHLKDNEFQMQNQRDKRAESLKGTPLAPINSKLTQVRNALGSAIKSVKPMDNSFGRDSLTDSKRAAESFMRKVRNEENADKNTRTGWMRAKAGAWLDYDKGAPKNPFSASKGARNDVIAQEIREGNRSGLLRYLSNSDPKKGAQAERESIKKYYNDKIADKTQSPNATVRKGFEKKRDEKLKESRDRREYFKNELKGLATKLGTKDSQQMAESLKKLQDLEGKKWNNLKDRLDANVDSLFKEGRDHFNRMAAGREQDEKEKDLMKEGREKEQKKSKEEFERMEKEKRDLMKEIVTTKMEVKSLEEIVAEIKDAERKQVNARDLTGDKEGEAGQRRKEENERGEKLKEALGNQLAGEYIDALQAQTKVQQDLLKPDATSQAEIDRLSKAAALFHQEQGPDESHYEAQMRKIEALNNARELHAMMVEKMNSLMPDEETAMKSLNSTQQEDLRKYGGLEAIKDGLTEIDNTTLFEKLERLKYFEENFPQQVIGQATVDSTQNQNGTARVASDDNVAAVSTGSVGTPAAAVTAPTPEAAIEDMKKPSTDKLEDETKDKEDSAALAALEKAKAQEAQAKADQEKAELEKAKAQEAQAKADQEKEEKDKQKEVDKTAQKNIKTSALNSARIEANKLIDKIAQLKTSGRLPEEIAKEIAKYQSDLEGFEQQISSIQSDINTLDNS